MEQQGTNGCELPQAVCDARRVTSELTEMLAMLVLPAMFLAGVGLIFG
ncbi:MAG TPA: hypothetical protein VEC11_02250 [Allosphingosinicella sp.]|nr:hypothetical protein [Allosphingosinicella sp.]